MKPFDTIVAVALNPAIDRIVEVPGFHAGGHQRGRRLTRYPAGKAINVARTMAMLGQPCVVSGFVGRAEEDWYRTFLQEQGRDGSGPLIDCRLVPVAGHTRENISVVDPLSPDSDTHIIEQGFSVKESDLDRLQEVLSPFAAPGRLIAFCGSLPEGLSADRFGTLLRFCLDRGAAVAVDSSGEALRVATQLPLWLVKPNREELAELMGRPLNAEDEQLAAATELARTTRWVLVSAGAEGAMLVDKKGNRRALLSIPSESVVGTVGCGDALVGGFLAGWQAAPSTDRPATERHLAALRRGVTSATFAATQLGRKIDLEQVERLERDVRLTVNENAGSE